MSAVVDDGDDVVAVRVYGATGRLLHVATATIAGLGAWIDAQAGEPWWPLRARIVAEAQHPED